MIPTQMGKYIARPLEWTAEESDAGNRLLQFICRFDLLQHWSGSEWVDVTQDGLSVTGYFYLMKSDGKPNTSTIDNLKASLGWDGRSVAGLANGDWASIEVQLTLATEEYQGKSRVKVKWIAPRDTDPRGAGLEKADPQTIQSLEAKYGATLRALGGGVPAKQLANGNGAGGKPVLAAPATPQQTAWKEFVLKWGEHIAEHPEDTDKRDERWREAMAEHFGAGNDPKKATAQQWTEFADMIRKDYSPALGSFIPI